MASYQYLECGLDNVFIEGLEPVVDDDGDEVIQIPMISMLHAEIARGIVTGCGRMTGAELRFLRTELGLTQNSLARKVNVDAQTVGRWERGETPLDNNAETIVRMVAGQKLVEAFDNTIEEIIARTQAERDSIICIEAGDQSYALCA